MMEPYHTSALHSPLHCLSAHIWKLGVAIALMSCVTAFAQQSDVTQQWPSALGKQLAPLPPPTEEQLKRGREILDKISFVAANVPLTDSEAVMKIFGFDSLYTWTYPTYVRKQPRAKNGAKALPEDLKGSGFTYLSTDPWASDAKDSFKASLNGALNKDEACISIDDVRRRFNSGTNMTADLIVDIHPVDRPKAVQGIGHLSFDPIQTFDGFVGGITFTFEYQACANSFGFAYKIN